MKNNYNPYLVYLINQYDWFLDEYKGKNFKLIKEKIFTNENKDGYLTDDYLYFIDNDKLYRFHTK